MNEKAIELEISQAIYEQFELWRKRLPYMTGHLSKDAFHIMRTNEGWKIYIDLTENVGAPYAAYIDRPDYKSYQYFDKEAKVFLQTLATQLHGTLKEV